VYSFPGQSEHLIRHSVPFILFKMKMSSGYLDLIDWVVAQSHLGGSVGVAPAGGAAEAPTVGGTDWLVGGLTCAAAGPEEVGAGGTELA